MPHNFDNFFKQLRRRENTSQTIDNSTMERVLYVYNYGKQYNDQTYLFIKQYIDNFLAEIFIDNTLRPEITFSLELFYNVLNNPLLGFGMVKISILQNLLKSYQPTLEIRHYLEASQKLLHLQEPPENNRKNIDFLQYAAEFDKLLKENFEKAEYRFFFENNGILPIVKSNKAQDEKSYLIKQQLYYKIIDITKENIPDLQQKILYACNFGYLSVLKYFWTLQDKDASFYTFRDARGMNNTTILHHIANSGCVECLLWAEEQLGIETLQQLYIKNTEHLSPAFYTTIGNQYNNPLLPIFLNWPIVDADSELVSHVDEDIISDSPIHGELIERAFASKNAYIIAFLHELINTNPFKFFQVWDYFQNPNEPNDVLNFEDLFEGNGFLAFLNFSHITYTAHLNILNQEKNAFLNHDFYPPEEPQILMAGI